MKTWLPTRSSFRLPLSSLTLPTWLAGVTLGLPKVCGWIGGWVVFGWTVCFGSNFGSCVGCQLRLVYGLRCKLGLIDALRRELGLVDGLRRELGLIDALRCELGLLDALRCELGLLDALRRELGLLDALGYELGLRLFDLLRGQLGLRRGLLHLRLGRWRWRRDLLRLRDRFRLLRRRDRLLHRRRRLRRRRVSFFFLGSSFCCARIMRPELDVSSKAFTICGSPIADTTVVASNTRR